MPPDQYEATLTEFVRQRGSEPVRVPGVRAGLTIVEGTRIGVHDVLALHLTGSSVDDIVRDYPLLTKAQVYECLAYYEDHRAEIERENAFP